MFTLAIGFTLGFVAGTNKDKSIAFARAAWAVVKSAFVPPKPPTS